jgi:hypothetical protein
MNFTVKALVPIGAYDSTLKSVEATEHPEYGKGSRFTFGIDTGAQAGQEVAVTCSSNSPPTQKNKLGRTLRGLLGRALQPGENISVTQFIGRKYHIVVEDNDAGDGVRVSSIVPVSV